MWTKHAEVDLSISETSDRHGSFSLVFSYIVRSTEYSVHSEQPWNLGSAPFSVPRSQQGVTCPIHIPQFKKLDIRSTSYIIPRISYIVYYRKIKPISRND